MSKTKPISPSEAKKAKESNIPDEIIEAVNKLLSERYDGSCSVCIKQKEIIEETAKFNPRLTKAEIFKNKWLDIEPTFRKHGWKVRYEKPSYGDSDFDAYFEFSQKK